MLSALLLTLTVAGGQPVRQCVTAPLYQTYQAPATQRYVDGVAYIAFDPYYSKLVGSQARAHAAVQSEKDLATQVGLLTTELANLRQQLAKAQTPAPTTPFVPPPPPIVPPPPGTLTDLGKQAQLIMQKKCGSCHTDPAKAGGSFKLFDSSSNLTTLAPLQKLKLDLKVYSGEMPPNPKDALSATEYSTIRAWINESKDDIESALADKGTK